MALSEKLELLISADPSKAVSEMQRFATSTDKSVRQAESSIKRLSSAALKIGGAGIGVGGLLTQMASEDIEAANQLKAAIGQVGQSYSEFEDRIDAAAEAQVRFGHTDDEVAGAVTTLTLAYNDTGKALDQLQLVADLAARKHISLGEAAGLVAKAHGGAGRVFKEFGITVQQNADGTKDFDGALTELAGKLKGQASASADTFGGKIEALKAQASNIASEFGQKWGPAILGVSTGLTALGSISTGLSAITTRLAAAHGAAAVGAETQAVAEGELAVASTGAAAGAAGLLKVLGPLALAVGAYQVAQDNFGNQHALLEDHLLKTGAATGWLKDQITAAIPTQEKATEASEDAKKALADQAKAVDELGKTYRSLVDGTLDQFEAQLALSDAEIATRKALEDLATARREGKLSNDEGLKLTNDTFAAILDEAKAYQSLALTLADGKTETEKATIAQNALVEKLYAVASTLDPNGDLYTQVIGYIQKLQGVPASVSTTFTLDTDEAVRALQALQREWAGVTEDTEISFTGKRTGNNARAMGGPVNAGQSYLIGERGPEVVTFGASGFVTPNDKLRGAGVPIKQTFIMPPNADIAEQASRGTRRALILSRR